MRKTIDGGVGAFPSIYDRYPNAIESVLIPGMSLRDWFAGQALRARWGDGTAMTPDDAASVAYQIADAMLAARKETAGEAS
jgi:hypothetical protein